MNAMACVVVKVRKCEHVRMEESQSKRKREKNSGFPSIQGSKQNERRLKSKERGKRKSEMRMKKGMRNKGEKMRNEEK